ncbi:MAG: hypothetical protein IPL33_16690 [Sphingobacteriales bacterium]|nr:hypothetical protein [Sphingobacteriales bacterium]
MEQQARPMVRNRLTTVLMPDYDLKYHTLPYANRQKQFAMGTKSEPLDADSVPSANDIQNTPLIAIDWLVGYDNQRLAIVYVGCPAVLELL